MYSKERFKNLVDRMVEVYGVRSYLDNLDDDEYPWFECPECGEPILYEDYDMSDYIDGDTWQCPICEEVLDIQ